ncbi:MAG: nucleoside triphosphate pyrophosphohydrolase [Bdellovibrionales bacterium]|nr:nucleoside triphosphate pyrophosphohydrolase [Bdellovibrionales bacterium]
MSHPIGNLREFQSLVKIIETLRGPQGCPWDKQQTHSSLTRFAIEEAHELAEAIDHAQSQAIKEELGDLLLQVVLHAEIARQENTFTIEDVIETLSEKMLRRHPHVFGNASAGSAEDVKKNWESIKQKEKDDKEFSFGLPSHLPALIASFKIGEKTKKYNFDWSEITPVLEKVEEELSELREAIQNQDRENMQEELGDILFSVAQVARHLDIDPEQALRKTNKKFETRFQKMVDWARMQNLDFKSLSPEKLEELWVIAKAKN